MYQIRTQLSSLPSHIDVLTEFPRWITQHCDSTSIVLDVGAGQGKTGNAVIIRQKVARLVGVDPDSNIMQNPYLDECYQTSIEDFAKSHDSDFDCLYATFVLEHITEPRKFLSACRSLLKPGGMLFGITPNLWHYFGLTTKLSALLGIEDWLLGHLMGTGVKNSYHFPTAYCLNSIRAIRHTLAQTGFQEVEFRCTDQTRRFKSYFPKPLRWLPSSYSRLIYMLRLPQLMGLIMFRATA
jgi:SAM-dependent methyltransferase